MNDETFLTKRSYNILKGEILNNWRFELNNGLLHSVVITAFQK